MIIARLLLSRLSALCLLISAVLVTLLPSPARCEGFVEGAYPRAIAYDKKSPAGAGPVRLLTFEKRAWRLPSPEGFLDIETLASPEHLKQALDRAMRWKERVQSLNGK